MTLRDVLARILADGEPRSTDELYAAVRSKVNNRRQVEWILAKSPDRFTETAAGWTLVGAAAETSAAEAVASSRDPFAELDPLEYALRDRARGRRLILEGGLDAALYEQVEQAMRRLVRGHLGSARIGELYPAIVTYFLVGHGVYHYEGGTFWDHITVPGVDISFGAIFERSLRRLRLETFEDMVYDDNGLRYVSPALAHGGIPKSCLPAFFSLLVRAVERVGADARDVMSYWRTRTSSFQGVPKPVRRFLLFGGDLAVAFLERCIEMLFDYSQHGQLPRPDDVGLPPYAVAAFKRFVQDEPDGIDQIRRSGGRRRPPIHVTLDPWTAVGPVVELPPVESDLSAPFWRLVARGSTQRVTASTYDVRVVPIPPASSWSVELHDGARLERQTMFEGLDTVPAVFFSPDTGRLAPVGSGLRGQSVWMARPKTCKVSAIGADGEATELRVIESLPDPVGEWDGFCIEEISLEGIRAIAIKERDDAPERRVTVQSTAARPELVGAPVPEVETEAGDPVYAELPLLRLPHLAAGEWSIRLTVDDLTKTLAPTDLEPRSEGFAFDAFVDHTTPSMVSIVVHGPLGRDLRETFLYVPRLTVTVPDRVLMPHDRRAVVTVTTPVVALRDGARDRHISVPPDADEVPIELAPTRTGPVRLRARVRKIMWGVASAGAAAPILANEIIPMAADDIVKGSTNLLMVRTGAAEVDLVLALQSSEGILQESPRQRTSGGDGRWIFDLRQFADSIRTSTSAHLDLLLRVGSVPTPVVRLHRSLELVELDVHSRIVGDLAIVDVDFAEIRSLSDRVVRLWDLDRPWRGSATEPVEDSERAHVHLALPTTLLPPGRYLVEVAVDDGWTTPRRPEPGSANTAEVTVGTRADLSAHLEQLARQSDPLAVLEVASMTGVVPRDLDDVDREVVVPGALEWVLEMARHRDPRKLTSRQRSAVESLLRSSSVSLVEAIVDAVGRGEADSVDVARLSVVLAPSLPPACVAQPDSEQLATLWDVAPALAAAFDIADVPGDGSDDWSDRMTIFAGWNPTAGIEGVPTGEPVTQLHLGLDGERLGQILHEIDLVPNRLLTLDALVAANFEWLQALADDPRPVQQWFREHHTLVSRGHPNPELDRHLRARQAPQGTEPIGSLPAVSLACAYHITNRSANAPAAERALLEACAFAPRLVQRDLVLSRVLLPGEISTEPTAEESP